MVSKLVLCHFDYVLFVAPLIAHGCASSADTGFVFWLVTVMIAKVKDLIFMFATHKTHVSMTSTKVHQANANDW